MHIFISQNKKCKQLIVNITFDTFLFYLNFASMKDIIRTCNSTVIFSKSTSNKNI